MYLIGFYLSADDTLACSSAEICYVTLFMMLGLIHAHAANARNCRDNLRHLESLRDESEVPLYEQKNSTGSAKKNLKKYKRMCLENKGETTGGHTEVRKRTFGREKPGARRQRGTGVTGSWSRRNRK